MSTIIQKSTFASTNDGDKYEILSSVAFPAYSAGKSEGYRVVQFSEDVMLPVTDTDPSPQNTLCNTYLISGTFSVAQKLPQRSYKYVQPQLVATSGQASDKMYTYNIVPVDPI